MTTEPNPRQATRLRRAALGVVGLAALGAGLGWQLSRRDAPATSEPAPAAGLWTHPFDTLGGQPPLTLAAFAGRSVLLNFWASWCPPCLEEMPLLERFQREFGPRGWQVVGLAVDNAPPVQAFLARHPVSFAIGIAGFSGSEWSRQLGNDAGALPFTAVFDTQGRQRVKHSGIVSWPLLQAWAAKQAPAS